MRSVDLPDALPDGSRFLHIGLPKTGTTALQGALDRARPELEALGAHNVNHGRHEMRVGQVAAGGLAEFWQGAWEKRWQALATEFRESDARCTFWSSESLSHARGERVAYLADQLGSDTHVVVTLRPLAPLMVSQWQQWLRRRGTQSLDEWAVNQFDAVTPDGEVTIDYLRFMPSLHRFSLRRIVEEWGPVFGEERIVLVVPDPTDRLRNFRVFERLMGVPDILQPVPEGNASLPYPEAEMLRHFNRAWTDHGGDHPTWMEVIGVLARIPLRDYTNTLEAHPIRAPRWVAERANEYAAAWNSAVEDSGVTVVGDLADLLVDPADYPERVDVPTTVDVESAGRLMDVAFTAALQHAARTPSGASQTPDLSSYGGRELVRELGRRARRRVGRG
ncbi:MULTISPECIES: hypothetical protein [unclassified Nocardioides]|uniref:hypothetical protein n=1 Tax=unclassified Nocardioides TaxID=2615069 RepID=UPI001153DF41|nr:MULTISPECIES: hypothetical protein [unclassified Nocardioides]TQK73180.1 hypothetical protein FBY23_5006 [Nocardioides sp. SLBN-35]WGY02582.1 hypothetical protein QI633_02225 [Nocardioides sp. QY071]